ncbi:TonB-linked outer membrane protein, SusC/RagA family [Spirosomataceae bacterium TFI 002]|nr:TonB-linked outer membrane protein, SusC/RagA family [Spirosomataceae bacterium TFI 002]
MYLRIPKQFVRGEKSLQSSYFKKVLAASLSLMFFVTQSFAFGLASEVKGKVTDENGAGLPGVTVTEKGTFNGVATNVEGEYSITVPNSSSVLVFSFVGYASQEVVVGNQTTINVQLAPDAANLEEIVVVGYGTQRKSQLTGAISTVKAADIKDLPIENTQQALQGRVAGVDVMQAGSKPGTQPRVVIRGRRSPNASSDPLYVLDGIPLSGGTGDINPNDIQSMEVLKDASATAIYGARGANGVVLITSRRGSSTGGKPKIFYDAYYGVSEALNTINFMDGPQFADAKREAYRIRNSDGTLGALQSDDVVFTSVELDGIAKNRSIDYINGLMRQGNRQNHSFGISGGDSKTQYYMSLNYYKDNGIVYNQDYNRNVLRVNLDHQLSKNIKMGMSTFINYSIRNGESFNPLGGAMRENPLGQPYEEDGSLRFLPTEDGLRSNPFSEIVDGAYIDRRKSNRMFSGIYAEAKIIDGLTYRLNLGPDFSIDKRDLFQGRFTNARRLAPPRASTDNFTQFNYTIENILNYTKTFGDHNFNLTGVQSFQRDNFETNGITVQDIPSEGQQFYNFGNAAIIESVRSNLVQRSLLSYMGRLNYGYKDKYLLTATLRADGASQFGDNTKWGYFPGVALAWNLSSEEFMKSVSAVDLAKVRVSYGTIGNQAISPYQTRGLLSQSAYNFGDNAFFGYGPNTIGNPDLRWESSTTLNIGLDFSMFRGRFSGSVEYYDVTTSDLLLKRNLPPSIGFTEVTTNVGATRNSGIEGTFSTVNMDNQKGFKWSTDFQFFMNKEQFVELPNGDDVGNNWYIGQPLSVIYDYKKIGIWQSNEIEQARSYGSNVGEIKIQDTDGDGKFTAADRVIQGSGVPKFSGGITNRFKLNNFDLSFFVYARLGQTIRSNFHTSNNSLFGRYNNIVVDYWTPTNPSNETPRPNQNQEFPVWGSSMNIFDGSFVKVRNINLGYRFTPEVAKKLGMESLRLYSSIQQPFIFAPFISKYNGIDPETDIDASLDGNVSPAAWTATIGINVTF